MAAILRKYGVQTDIYFPMVKRAVVDLAVTADWTPATGDTKISLDGAAQANTSNNPAIAAGVSWKLTLTASEMQAAIIAVMIVDSATKAVEDQYILIETFGHTSSIYPGEDWSDGNWHADKLLKRDMSAVSGEASRSPLNALRVLRNMWQIVASTFTVFKEDDSTTAWTSTLTATANQDAITKSDPA